MDNDLLDKIMVELDPGAQPCGCCEYTSSTWVQICDCQNNSDLADAQSWCTAKNCMAAIERLLKEHEAT